MYNENKVLFMEHNSVQIIYKINYQLRQLLKFPIPIPVIWKVSIPIPVTLTNFNSNFGIAATQLELDPTLAHIYGTISL